MHTYITLNLHHIFGQFHTDCIRQESVMAWQVLVIGIAGNFLGLLGSYNSDHIQWSVVFGFALLIVFLVLPIRLHLGYIHIMDQLGVILDALEAN